MQTSQYQCAVTLIDSALIGVLQQKAQESEKRLLHTYRRLQQLTTIFSKITEVILEDFEVPPLPMRKSLPYQKITSILKLVFHLHWVPYIMIFIFKHNYKALVSQYRPTAIEFDWLSHQPLFFQNWKPSFFKDGQISEV